MLMAYSLLRVNYLGFVTFLTIYIVITFHFLNPVEYQHLIWERLIDTFIGSVIAALAARFIFPVWEHENINKAMREMLEANRAYFSAAWNQITSSSTENNLQNTARAEAIVALTNLSDNFQQMLAEPGQGKASSHIHQFVIASHALTSRISALSTRDLNNAPHDWSQSGKLHIVNILNDSIKNLEYPDETIPLLAEAGVKFKTVNALSMIYSLAREIRAITHKMATTKE
jgi:uncharacterized membrane protein YccC